jgi:rod shape-determining protein MreC
MTADHRQHHLEKVRAVASVVIYPVQWLVNLPFAGIEWITETLSTHSALIEDNSRLNEQNTLLKVQLQKYAALENENMRLRELLESSFKVGDRVLIAELLRINLEAYTQQIVLNKGSRDGVYSGQPLVDADGVMGQIIHLGPYTSTAMLITDPNHALPVRLNRNGLRSIAVGTGSQTELELQYIPTNADIREGDLLVTSGLGGTFPPGYPVATVTSIEKVPGLHFSRVVAAPMASLQQSREALLVWPPGQATETEEPAIPETVSATGNEKP